MNGSSKITRAKEQDEDAERETSSARRKALSQVVPLAFGTFIKAQETLSPFSILKVADNMDLVVQQQLGLVKSFLSSKFPQLQYLDLSLVGSGKYTFTTTREQVLSNLVSQYMRLKHNEESPFICPFSVLPASGALDDESYDCELVLQAGTVFGRLIQEKPQVSTLVSLQSKAISSSTMCEIWLFVTSGLTKSEEAYFLLDPTFATERKFHPGRIMVVGLDTVCAESVRGEEFTLETVEIEKRRVEENAQTEVFKMTLIENPANSRCQSTRKT